jgi:hypothetical protein
MAVSTAVSRAVSARPQQCRCGRAPGTDRAAACQVTSSALRKDAHSADMIGEAIMTNVRICSIPAGAGLPRFP